jgi:hypothetical protein
LAAYSCPVQSLTQRLTTEKAPLGRKRGQETDRQGKRQSQLIFHKYPASSRWPGLGQMASNQRPVPLPEGSWTPHCVPAGQGPTPRTAPARQTSYRGCREEDEPPYSEGGPWDPTQLLCNPWAPYPCRSARLEGSAHPSVLHTKSVTNGQLQGTDVLGCFSGTQGLKKGFRGRERAKQGDGSPRILHCPCVTAEAMEAWTRGLEVSQKRIRVWVYRLK